MRTALIGACLLAVLPPGAAAQTREPVTAQDLLIELERLEKEDRTRETESRERLRSVSECVLKHMPGTGSDIAAALILEACKRLYSGDD